MYSKWKKWTSLALAAALSIGAPSYAHADDLTSSSSVSSSDSTSNSSASSASGETDAETQANAGTDSDTAVSNGSAKEGASADSLSDQAKDSHTDEETDSSSSSSEASEEDQETIVSSDSTSTKSVSADSSSDTGNSEEGRNSIDFSNLDFSSMRLVIGTSDDSLVSDDKAVVGSCDNVYLAQYDSEEETEKAYEKYFGKADFVEPDTGLGAAEDSSEGTANTMTEEPMTEESNPMQKLSAADDSSDAAADSADVVALIDTGSSSYTSGSVSMLGDDGVDKNGHGTEMARLITEEAEDTSILSIKALNDAGDGTVSSVYAAIEYAISQDVKAINLSLSGYAMNDREAIDQAIHDAVSAGVLVVGAAGNNGRDASFFVPGRCTDAYIIGSCDKNGKRLFSSNYGDTVDYFVTSGSTSEAAAKFTGKLVKAGFVVDDTVKAGGVFTGDGESLSTTEEKTEEKADENTDKETKLSAAEDTITVTLNANGGTFSDGTTTKQVQCTKKNGSTWYSDCKQVFPSPTKSGQLFYGWNTTSNATSEMWQQLTDGETIYALYTRTSGRWGSCRWSFDASTGELTIGAGTGAEGRKYEDYPWCHFNDQIKKINATGLVILPEICASIFEGCSALISINLVNFYTGHVSNMSDMFRECSSLPNLDLSNFYTSNTTNMMGLFMGCKSLTSIDVSRFDTSKVTTMSGMFDRCKKLTSLNVSNFDTSKVKYMDSMFMACTNLTNLDISKLNTSSVINMSMMFYGCESLAKIDVSNFDTSNVTSMSLMFKDCRKLTNLDVSNFDTQKVTQMKWMFDECNSLTNLDLSRFETSSVTDMWNMFCNCSNLTTLDVSHFNTANVTNMDAMFYNCNKLANLDVSSFNTSNVENMRVMFYKCDNLKSLDLSNFDTSKVTNMSWMLGNSKANTALSKITLGSNFVIPSTNNNSCFPSLIEKTYSGQLTNNKWGLGSENAATQYSADDLIRLGQTKGKLTGTWYAQALKNYTLTYNGNGGTPSATLQTGYETQKWGTLATATRSGYTFQGWYTAASGGTQVTSSTSCTANLTVYAHWTANTYTNSISHWTWGYTNKEGNNGDAKNAFKIGDTTFNETCGAKYILNASNGVKIPNGYYLANSFGTSSISNSWGNYAFGTEITQNAGGMGFEYDYYPTNYSITYQLNGGTNNSSNPSSYNVLYGVTFATPTRSGYTFAGWTIEGKAVTGINAGANASFTSATDLYNKLAARTTGNKTVVANWSANGYTVAFNGNGNTGGSTANEGFTYDTAKALTANGFTKAHYHFTGWNTKADGSGTTYANSASVKNLATGGTVTLYAQWAIDTHVFDLQGGNIAAYGTADVYINGKLVANDVTDYCTAWPYGTTWEIKDIKPKAGVTYDGASSALSGTLGDGDTVINLRFHWNTYTVKFASNGGSGTTADQAFTYGTAQALRSNGFSRTGYAFAGWTGSNGKTYTNGQSVSNLTATDKGTFTMTARWTPNAYTIAFSGNGGSGTMANESMTYDTTKALTANSFTRTGYTFNGWNTKADGSGTSYTNGASVKNLATGGTVTLYAQWTVNQYTVTCEDWFVDASNNRKVKLGASTKAMTYGSTANGTAWGTDKTISKYYTGYVYHNATIAIVGTSGATVYRYFWAWTNINILNAEGTETGNVATFSLSSDGGATWQTGLKNENTHSENDVIKPYGTTYIIKDLVPVNTYEEYNSCSLATYNNGQWSYTPTVGGSVMVLRMKYKSYSIGYTLNGGAVSGNPTSYNYTTAAITLKNPTRTGYTFAGWTGSNGTTAQTTVTIPQGSYGNKSYTANWKANIDTKYVVYHQQEQLDGSYKTVDIDSLTGTTDTTVKPAVKTYTGFTSPAVQSLTIKGDGTAVVNYKYTRNSYIVTRQYRLENADGTFAAYTTIDSKKYKYGASVAVWNRAADTTYQAASIAAYTVPAKGSTLSVDVKRLTSTNNKIQYRLQNADGSYPSAYTVGWSGTLRAGENYTWSYSQTASHKAISKTISYNGGIVSIDVPRRTGRLVIKANGGTGDRTSTDIIYGSTCDSINPLPTRTGYTLTGLYTAASGGTQVANADGKPSNDGTYSKDNAWLLTSDVTVYAQWTANETIVTFDPRGGKNNLGSGSDQQSYFFDKEWNYVQLLPTKTGCTFEGYYTEKSGAGVKVYGTGIDPDWHPNDSTIYMIATPGTGYWKLTKTTECIWQYAGSTLTVYAHWIPNTYTVAFNGNGSTGGTMLDESMVYDTAKTLTTNSFSRTGYTFSGWNTKVDGSGTSYADKASVKNLAESGTVTLYAQWTANTYTVTIPTAITYSNMPIGNVNVTNTYDVSIDCKTGSFSDTIEVASTPSPMVPRSGKGNSLAVSSGSSKLPLSFTAAGTKQDQATITGTANTADVWTGAIQYIVTKK